MAANSTNPLLEIKFKIPFDQIKAGHVEPAVDALIAEAQQNIDAIAADPGPRTYDNTLRAFENAAETLEYAMSVVSHLESVATYPELRDAYNAVEPKVSAFDSKIPLNEALWKQIKRFSETEEAALLSGSRARFLKKTLDEFRRSGADLDEAGKARLNELNVQLAQATTKYSQNVLDATNAFELMIEDEARLAGLPPSAVALAHQDAESKGKPGWRFTLQAPSYIAVMTYLDDAAIREMVYRAYVTRGAKEPCDNRELILTILRLRREKARLLGYRDFADLVLEDRMAKTGRSARGFVDSLKTKTRSAFERENQELLAFRREIEGPNAPELDAWDIAYYAEKMRQAIYDFEEEELRPYFAFEKVLDGMFELVGRLYGIKVFEESGVPAWDNSAKYYSIDDADGTRLGSFYADFYPRENKRGGAWMDSFFVSVPGGQRPHLGLICGNQTPPVDGKPALLTHREVETIFHEFGHLLHHLLSRVEVRSLGGTNVAWDFVELPSQIMENWCWERDALDLFARHYETGEPIPTDLFQKMKRARNFRVANAQMRQLSFGTVDLALHRDYDPQKNGDVMKYAFDIMHSFAPTALPSEHAMIASFSHLFASPVGYGAGYYSYKWSEVLDADAFSRFANEGIFSQEVGMQFRERILARGDSEDPAQLFRDFMGRDPDADALLHRQGLLPAG
ncbi:MAG: M3 family metallopeptidase [Bryobacterales bacterium]|nr:M3 family metallopeptidase [Bryobacterales bacterium]MDE0294274.1 M3 family metallopeptidase [Bryobacterales bacterium]